MALTIHLLASKGCHKRGPQPLAKRRVNSGEVNPETRRHSRADRPDVGSRMRTKEPRYSEPLHQGEREPGIANPTAIGGEVSKTLG